MTGIADPVAAGLIRKNGAVAQRAGALKIAQVASAMPSQTPIQSGARDIRVQKLTHLGQKIIQ